MPRAVLIHNSGPGAELGHLGTWLAERRFDVDLLSRDQAFAADAADGADLLVMLGSRWSLARPMTGPGDDPRAPSAVAAEVELVQRRLAEDLPTLGICFGGQLLCRALGGEVSHLERTFIEWETPRSGIAALSSEWFFVHEDHVTLPDHVTPLAVADHANVAFRHGRAWGLQFHPEVDAHTLEVWFDDLGMERETAKRHIDRVRAREDANRTDAHALFDSIWSSIGRRENAAAV